MYMLMLLLKDDGFTRLMLAVLLFSSCQRALSKKTVSYEQEGIKEKRGTAFLIQQHNTFTVIG